MRAPVLPSIVLSVVCLLAVDRSDAAAPRSLTFDERVQCQRAIEEVNWKHRTWPAENRRAKPALSEVVSDDALRAKVEASLANARALEQRWRRPLTSAQLQAELERMARDTQDGQRLREIFAALGNDPFLAAECLARPVLAERLLQTWSSAPDVTTSAPARDTTDVRPYVLPHATATSCTPGTWRPIQQVPSARVGAAAFWTGSEMLIWGGTRESPEIGGQTLTDGALYDPATDSWRPIDSNAPGAPRARSGSSAVWTGTELIVWGGDGDYEGIGARFNPATNTWTPIAAGAGSPSGRMLHVAAWTGSSMIVWGGTNWQGIALQDGARFDPATGTWTAMSTTGPRVGDAPLAAWTGSQFLLWNGPDTESGRYDPVLDTWLPMSRESGPNSYAATAVWTGSLFIVWGGYTNEGARYDPVTDTWTPTSTVGTPGVLHDHSAVWTGTEMIVWGGTSRWGGSQSGGARYEPVSDT